MFDLLELAPEGLLIYSVSFSSYVAHMCYLRVVTVLLQSSRPNAVGTVIKNYSGYRNVKVIDSGGFGNVYQYSDKTAVKEEFKVCLYLCIIIYY